VAVSLACAADSSATSDARAIQILFKLFDKPGTHKRGISGYIAEDRRRSEGL
jgi:hypothetical protein